MLKKSRFGLFIPILALGFFINCYCSVPSTVNLTEGAEYNLALKPYMNISGDALPTASNGEALAERTAQGVSLNTAASGRYSIGVKMFNLIPLKNIEVNVSPEYSVIPSGKPVGIKIFADGLLIINIADVKTSTGTISPAKAAGLAVGDRIISANSVSPSTSEELARIINKAEGDVLLKIQRGESLHELSITPAIAAEDGTKKLGIWVRDSTAGVGTMTFYDPKSRSFATLGHAITDADTGVIILPKEGALCDCEIISTKKGISGTPGELSGRFGVNNLGNILMNSSLGVYGRLTDGDLLDDTGYMQVATRFEVKTGAAYIMADVDGGGVMQYDINIDEVSKSARIDNKSMVISVTDPVLLAKTGGIVQGMSGSPIIQNGKLVGAVTHVFVNDPTRGYGIFAENMLDTALYLQ